MQKKKRIYIVFLIKYGKNISLRFFINPSQLFRISRMSPALFLVRIYLPVCVQTSKIMLNCNLTRE